MFAGKAVLYISRKSTFYRNEKRGNVYKYQLESLMSDKNQNSVQGKDKGKKKRERGGEGDGAYLLIEISNWIRKKQKKGH